MNLLETLIRFFLGLVDGILGLFEVLHQADKHLGAQSKLGESGFEKEMRHKRDLFFMNWRWLLLAICLLLGLGMVAWDWLGSKN